MIRAFITSFNHIPAQGESSGASSGQPMPSIRPQVQNPNLEHYRRTNEQSYRQMDPRAESRKDLYKKVEMPLFSRSNPFDWIARAERYFRVMQCSP